MTSEDTQCSEGHYDLDDAALVGKRGNRLKTPNARKGITTT